MKNQNHFKRYIKSLTPSEFEDLANVVFETNISELLDLSNLFDKLSMFLFYDSFKSRIYEIEKHNLSEMHQIIHLKVEDNRVRIGSIRNKVFLPGKGLLYPKEELVNLQKAIDLQQERRKLSTTISSLTKNYFNTKVFITK